MVELHRLHSTDEARFATLITLYQEAFPVSERKPPATLRQMLASDRYRFLLATEQGTAVGFAILRTLSNATLLEYMAIDPVHRGRGLGSAIVRSVQTQTLLLEVESDRIPDADRTRRKQFYRALGAREIEGLRWIMPPVASTPPPPMEILAFTPHTSLPRTTLHSWLREIYVEVYGQTPTDPRLEAMLADLPDEVPLV